MGSQTFAFSPFNQYYDDWLVNLKGVLSEFESNPATKIDTIFSDERGRIVANIEYKLAERRKDEFAQEDAVTKLNDRNHSLADLDAEYAAETRKLSSEKNAQIADLTRKLHEFEEELEKALKIKTSSFKPFSKKAKTQKVGEATQKVEGAKKNIEATLRSFEIEQEKLHDEYERKKEAVIIEVRELEKEVESLETDNSMEDRKIACEALVSAVKDLISRSKA